MNADPGRWLLVQLEADLHRSRVTGLWHNISGLPGVESVTDLSETTQETLDVILMNPDIPILPAAPAERQKTLFAETSPGVFLPRPAEAS